MNKLTNKIEMLFVILSWTNITSIGNELNESYLFIRVFLANPSGFFVDVLRRMLHVEVSCFIRLQTVVSGRHLAPFDVLHRLWSDDYVSSPTSVENLN